MFNRIDEFIKQNEIIYKYQFGFRSGYSTNHALLSIIEEIRSNLDKKTFSCGVFVDLEKAFDTVNHKILLEKLKFYGIKGLANKWLNSYLSNRTQSVTLNGTVSNSLPVSCGVPQGSILGPLLFLIYINDMHSAFKDCKVHHFADDTNLLFSHKDPEIIRKTMNKELKLLFDWLCANRLSLNVAKTEFIIFRPPNRGLKNRITLELNKTKIHESTKIKYLGLILDRKLAWNHHISELSKKLSRAVGMLYKIRDFTPKRVLKSLYHSLFGSHLAYGLPVWGYASKLYTSRIKKLQKRAIRAITFSSYTAHTKPLFKDLDILPLDNLLFHKMSSLMWDVDKNILPPSLSSYFKKRDQVHDFNTRQASSGKYHIQAKNTIKYGVNSFQNKGALILNELKDMDIYSNARTKKQFLNNLKISLTNAD